MIYIADGSLLNAKVPFVDATVKLKMRLTLKMTLFEKSPWLDDGSISNWRKPSAAHDLLGSVVVSIESCKGVHATIEIRYIELIEMFNCWKRWRMEMNGRCITLSQTASMFSNQRILKRCSMVECSMTTLKLEDGLMMATFDTTKMACKSKLKLVLRHPLASHGYFFN